MTPTREETSSRGAVLDAGEIARLVGGRLDGDPSVRVRDVAPLDQAADDELGLLAGKRYLDRVADTRAGALLVAEELAPEAEAVDGGPPTLVVVDDPYRALPPLLERFHPPRRVEAGVHPTASIGPGVQLADDVTVGPYAVLEAGVIVEEACRLGPHVVAGRGSRIGAGSVLHPHVVLYPGSVLGERVVLHAGVRIGVDGFGYVTVDGEHRKIPQVGSCVVGDDVEIGANATVDRGSIGTTEIGRGVKLDNLVQVGHNVRVGERSILAAQVGIAGSARLGRGIQCGGQAGLAGHIEVGDEARIGGQAGVIGDLEAGATVSGYPARDHRRYLRGMSGVMRLPELRRAVRDLERRLEELEDGA